MLQATQFFILLVWTKMTEMDLQNQICVKNIYLTDVRITVPGLEWREWHLTVWSELPLRSRRPSLREVRTSVAPKWAWKHPTQVKLGTDQTLISPDTEPEHIVDEDEKQRLRTDVLWPHRDWKQHSYNITKHSGNSSFAHIFMHKTTLNLFKKIFPLFVPKKAGWMWILWVTPVRSLCVFHWELTTSLLFCSQFHIITFPFQQPAARRCSSGWKDTQFNGPGLNQAATSLALVDQTWPQKKTKKQTKSLTITNAEM